MNTTPTTLRQNVEQFFGQMFEQAHFNLVFEQEPKCLIYQTGSLRLRVTQVRMDTDIYIGGTDALLDPDDTQGWYPWDHFADFLEDRRSVDHLFHPNFGEGFDEMMRNTARRLAAHLPTLLTWFETEGLAQRMATYQSFSAWRKAAIKAQRLKTRK